MQDWRSLDQPFLNRQTTLICQSYLHWTGLHLLEPERGDDVRCLFEADFAVLSHNAAPEPIFNYANQAAMRLFGMHWDEITQLPSRYSAEPMLREVRAEFLARVAAHGFVDDYTGVRVAKDGRKFLIRNATVWNLLDSAGQVCGQAAMIPEWQAL